MAIAGGAAASAGVNAAPTPSGVEKKPAEPAQNPDKGAGEDKDKHEKKGSEAKKKKGAGKGAAKDKKEGGAEPKDKTQGKITTAMNVATKLKVRYNSAVAASNSLIAMIKSGTKGWDWADNKQNVGSLEKLLKDLTDNLDGFQRELITSQLRSLRKKYGEEHLLVTLEDWAEKIGPSVEALTNEHKRLVARATFK